MQITTIGIDLSKTVFQVHAVDADGATVVRKRLRRAEVLSFFAGLEPCLIGMEACVTSHYWARELTKFGHTGAPSREAAKALIFTPVWETLEGIPMSITRRQFLTNAGVSLTASALVSTRAMSIGEVGQSDSNALDDWSVVRDQFNLSPEYIHLATFALVSHPRPVREAIQKYRRALDENPFLVVDRGLWGPEAENLPHKVREAAAEYIGGRPEEIALTGNTTMGLALVYYGLPLRAGQEVLTTAHDHFSHHESIRLATERAGASMRKIILFDSFDAISADSIVNRIRSAVRPSTRAVGITWVH